MPWSHEPNRGFLRALAALSRAAGAIGETDRSSAGAPTSCATPPAREPRRSASDHAGRGAGGRDRRTGARAGGVRVDPVRPVAGPGARAWRRRPGPRRPRRRTGRPPTPTQPGDVDAGRARLRATPAAPRPGRPRPRTAPPDRLADRPTAPGAAPRRGRGGLPAADARAAGRAAVHGRHPRHRRERDDVAGGRPPARGVGHPHRPQPRRRGGDAGGDPPAAGRGDHRGHRRRPAGGVGRPGGRQRAGPAGAGVLPHAHRADPGRLDPGGAEALVERLGPPARRGRRQPQPRAGDGHGPQRRRREDEPADRLLPPRVRLHARHRGRPRHRVHRRDGVLAGRHRGQALPRAGAGPGQHRHQRRGDRHRHHRARRLPGAVRRRRPRRHPVPHAVHGVLLAHRPPAPGRVLRHGAAGPGPPAARLPRRHRQRRPRQREAGREVDAGPARHPCSSTPAATWC